MPAGAGFARIDGAPVLTQALSIMVERVAHLPGRWSFVIAAGTLRSARIDKALFGKAL